MNQLNNALNNIREENDQLRCDNNKLKREIDKISIKKKIMKC